jgi:hypothetical protein
VLAGAAWDSTATSGKSLKHGFAGQGRHQRQPGSEIQGNLDSNTGAQGPMSQPHTPLMTRPVRGILEDATLQIMACALGCLRLGMT